MSKLIEKVRAEMTGRERPTPFKIVQVTADIDLRPEVYACVQRQYFIKAAFTQVIWCEPSKLHPMLDRFIRALRREIYGDLYDMLDRLHAAVFEEDMQKIESIVRDITAEIEGH